MDDRKYWLGFNLVKGIGAVRLNALLHHFGDARTAWSSSAADLKAAGLSPRLAERICAARENADLDRIWEELAARGIRVLTWADEDYPRRLQEIDQPPPVLYVRGQLLPEDAFAVAIVGTRRITPYGRQITDELASHLAAQGITIVSGLARGVDAAAHSAAIRAGGRTIAVLGSGVDRVYPPEHRALAEKIQQQGALVSDYPVGAAPDAANFPPRNRIISGLSLAVIVVEAGETSGALITAGFAAEQGREVFAVPGSVLAPQSKGTNRLIQTGAQPLLSAQDVLQALDLTQAGQKASARRVLPTDSTERQLLEILGEQALHVDEIRGRSDLPIEKVSAALVLMELKGLVRQVGGMNYVAVREVQSDYSI